MNTLRQAALEALDYIRSTADYKMGHPPACEVALDLADALAEPQGEPVAYLYHDARTPHDAHPWLHSTMLVLAADRRPGLRGETPLYTAPQPAKRVQLTAREIELIDGMIEVQLDHAERCDAIANRRMASKQKEWDMERVELLRKIRAHGITGEPT